MCSRPSHRPDARIRCNTRIPSCRSREQDIGFGGLDRRSFSGIPGGFGFFSDSHVGHFLSKPSTCRRIIGRSPSYNKDATQREWYRYWSVGMYALLGVISGLADGISHHYLQPRDRNRRDHWNRCFGFSTTTYPGH